MGKSWKTRSHTKTGYPYNPIRAAQLQVLRPKVRQDDEENLFLGIYAEGHPVFSKAEFKAAGPDLKHLEFLRSYCQYYVAKLGIAYNTSRACLPPACLAGLKSVESRVTSLSAPLLNGLQNGGERALWTLDAKVEAVVRAAHFGVPDSRSSERDIILSEAPESRQAYLQRLEETVQFLRENGLAGTARHAIGMLLDKLDEAHKISGGEAGDELLPLFAWSKMAAYTPVNRLLEKAQPSFEFTQRKYTYAHDAVVSSAMYNRAVETAAEILQRVTETALFKVAERFYPAISGVADPALEKIASSSYTRAVINHLKPISREEDKSFGPIISCVPC